MRSYRRPTGLVVVLAGVIFAVALDLTGTTLGAGLERGYTETQSAVVNVDRARLALRGYDPVAYFTEARPVKGSASFTATHHGATYRFASAASRDQFVQDPARYVPQYGGFCAWAAASGYKADADPTAWAIVGDKLYVNYNASVQKSWSADAAALIAKADVNWPSVAAKALR